jgi:DNA polymerase III epsilon subunit-like protein
LVTFSGFYDLGYLMKLLTGGQPLPRTVDAFDEALTSCFPKRCELKAVLPPYGSLSSWAEHYNLPRFGAAHSAGSDALVTLRLYMHLFERGTAEAAELLGSESNGNENDIGTAGGFNVAPATTWSSYARAAALEAAAATVEPAAYVEQQRKEEKALLKVAPSNLWAASARAAASEAAQAARVARLNEWTLKDFRGSSSSQMRYQGPTARRHIGAN